MHRVQAHCAATSWALAALIVIAGRPSPAAAGTAALSCAIVDDAGGAAIPARCRIIDANGSNRYPPLSASFYHTAGGGYFYTGGSFVCVVPTGRVIITVKHGFEYEEAVDTFVVRADTSVTIRLGRVVAMDSLGWYAGDTHLHINHEGGYYLLRPDNALLMGRAEGLNIVNCLDDGYYFTGASDPCSTPQCVVFMSEEWRSSSYGHFGLLGLSSLVDPTSSIWWPMSMDAADSAHARRGALVIQDHPIPSDLFTQVESWPGNGIARELPVDCIADRVDALDVMSYSNVHNGGIELDLWYRLLDCGFHLPASAGTDAAMNRLDSNPLGAFRTYAFLGDEGMIAENWFGALAAGRTFVTNGPLITRFTVDGRGAGDSLSFSQPGAVVRVEIAERSAWPVDRIEIVRNGVPDATVLIDPPRCSVDTSVVLSIPASSWIAGRVHGTRAGWIAAGDYLCAHTSPVYVTVGRQRVREREDAEYFAQWIENLELLAQAKGEWGDTVQASRVFRELAAARAFYQGLSGAVTSSDASGTPAALHCENLPNPFGNGTVISFDVPAAGSGERAGGVKLSIYDVSGRLVRSLVDASLPAGRHSVAWDGRDARGRNVPSGIYFARISGRGSFFTHKMVVVR